jgi:quercetin dioxygenase-like cupin family protein
MIHLTVDDVEPDAEASSRPGWAGTTVRWVASNAYGATKGTIAVVDIEPGGGYEVHRTAGVERALYVLTGAGTHTGSGDDVAVERGDALFVRPDQWHGFAASSQTRLIVLYAPGPVPAELPYEAGRAGSYAGGEVWKSTPESAPTESAINEDLGFYGMTIKVLVNEDNGGSKEFQLGTTVFAEGGVHELHRHVHAEEFLYFIEGERGEQLTDGEPLTTYPGDLNYCTCGEWHGHGISGTYGFYVFSYVGVGNGAAAGYELHDHDKQAKVAALLAEMGASS